MFAPIRTAVQGTAQAGDTNTGGRKPVSEEKLLPRFNTEFTCPARETGTAFVPYIGTELTDILCEQYERTVGNDNCVHFDNHILQIPLTSIDLTM